MFPAEAALACKVGGGEFGVLEGYFLVAAPTAVLAALEPEEPMTDMS